MENGSINMNKRLPFDMLKQVKLYGIFTVNYSKTYKCFRIFNTFQLLCKHDSETPLYSERYGYSKYRKIGKWRFKFCKLK